jgi:hypothetical protein
MEEEQMSEKPSAWAVRYATFAGVILVWALTAHGRDIAQGVE